VGVGAGRQAHGLEGFLSGWKLISGGAALRIDKINHALVKCRAAVPHLHTRRGPTLAVAIYFEALMPRPLSMAPRIGSLEKPSAAFFI
jgi:hypothetical protein